MLVADGGDPAAIVAARGLGALDDGDELAAIVARVIAADPAAAQKVRDGNEKAIGALIGPVMRETRGRADGAEVTRLIREALGVGAVLSVRGPAAGRARRDLGQAANDARARVPPSMLAMNTPNATSRFLLIPQVAEASTMAKAPVLRRYSLARLARLLVTRHGPRSVRRPRSAGRRSPAR